MITKFKSSKYSICKPKTTFERMQTHFKLAPAKRNGCTAVTIPAPSPSSNQSASSKPTSTEPSLDELYARIVGPNTTRPGTDSAIEELCARIFPQSSSSTHGVISSTEDMAKSPDMTQNTIPPPTSQTTLQHLYHQQQQQQQSYAQLYNHQQTHHHQHQQMNHHQQTHHYQQHQPPTSVFQFTAPAVPSNQLDLSGNDVTFAPYSANHNQQPHSQFVTFQFGTNQYFTMNPPKECSDQGVSFPAPLATSLPVNMVPSVYGIPETVGCVTSAPIAVQDQRPQNVVEPSPSSLMMALQTYSWKQCQSPPSSDTPSTQVNNTKFDPFKFNSTDNLPNLFDLPEYEYPLLSRRGSIFAQQISSALPFPCHGSVEDPVPDVLDELKEYLKKREREEPGTTTLPDDESNFFSRKRRKSVCNEQIGQFSFTNPLFNDVVAPYECAQYNTHN